MHTGGSSLTEVLSDSLRRMHFSDEESDRLIGLDESEVAALVRHLAPMVEKLAAEQADGLERLLQAQREHDRYTEGWDVGYRQGLHDGSAPRSGAEGE